MKRRNIIIIVLSCLFLLSGCNKNEEKYDYSKDIDPNSTIFFQNIDNNEVSSNNQESDNDSKKEQSNNDKKVYYKKENDGKYSVVTDESDFEVYEIYTVTVTSSGELIYESVNNPSFSNSSNNNGSGNSSTPSSSSQNSSSNTNSNNSSGNNNNGNSSQTVKKSNLVSYNGWLKLSGTNIVNQYGEKIQLKGMSSHGLQWYGELVNQNNVKVLRDEWNSNVFRLAMYTAEGGYLDNKSIYNVLEKDIDMLISMDMYVIVDWHILSDNNPSSHTKEAKEFFNKVSSKYGSNPNIIYEICNEPHWVNWDNDIKPYSDEVISVIRKNSPNSLIIVGTNTWSQDVLDPINNRIQDDKVLYALHFYSGTHTSWLRDRADQALRAGIPIFVSEWGTSDASGNGGVYLDEAQKWVDWMKSNNISWASWSLSNKNESSALLKPGTSIINDNNLSESGKFVKKAIKG